MKKGLSLLEARKSAKGEALDGLYKDYIVNRSAAGWEY